MDFPKSVPNAGLVNGRFVDENVGTGQPGSLIPATWGNAVTLEVMSVLDLAGILPDEAKYDQLAVAISKIVTEKTQNALRRGDYGLGGVDLSESGSDVIGRPGGFYFFGESQNSFVSYASVLNLPYGAGNSAQLAIRQGATKASAAIRSVNAQGGWTPLAELWTNANYNPALKANLASPVFTGIPKVPTPATDTNTDQAASTAFVRAAIAALVGSSPEALDSLNELAQALGNDPNFATTMNNALASKAAKADSLDGYGIKNAYTKIEMNTALGGKFDKSGGTIDGSLYVTSPQSLSSPAFSVNSDTPGSALSAMRIRCLNTGVLLTHTNGTNALSVITAAGTAATISAGEVLASGSPCHTAASFMKPVAGQWISLTGGATLPAGGTWAYQVSTFNNTGTLIAGSTAGLAAGGTQLGHATSIGFAWRIQ
ncbi:MULTISPECIES: hypothetical protein [Pseudomonas]|uniref:hypothetical protein n=1 Tax=Pseudomonas TaxID=286 RepID=UPI001C0A8472|nr:MULTISPECIES: hypothetical protein [Pseudomonas]VCU63139.1 hypothetical protein [Pseudomonas synxantha]